MNTYDYTLRNETITAILRGLAKSTDVDKPGTRDNMRAMALLDEKRRRDKRRKQSMQISNQ
jgi:hypothetical protein